MAIPAIDNLSQVLIVNRVQAPQRTQAPQLTQRTSFETVVAPSRSKELIALATAKAGFLEDLVNGLKTLVKAADKTALPTPFPDTSRVSIQAEITNILKNINSIVESAEIGTISLLRSDNRPIYLQTNELGGKIRVQGVALDTDALGLSKINVLSELGIDDALRRTQSASYGASERVSRLEQLAEALFNATNFGQLTNVSPTASLPTNVASNFAASGSLYPPVSFVSPNTGQGENQLYNRGSYIDLIG